MRTKLSISGLILSMVIWAACTPEPVTENLVVAQMGKQYSVSGQLSGKKLFSSVFADAAIQYAINLLPKGGMVSLESGNFIVKNQINLKSFITLTGSGNATIIRMQPDHATGIAIKGDSLMKTTVSDFSVMAAKNDSSAIAAVTLTSCGDCQVSDVFCLGMQKAGVWFNEDTYLSEIRSCKFAKIKGAGILLEGLAEGIGGEYLPNLVTNCIAYRCGIGFLCSQAIVVNFGSCLAHQCKNAFNLQNGSNSICISNCRSFQIEQEAVIVNNSAEINITGNIFCWSVKEAIKFEKVRWGTVTGNNLIDVGSVNFYTRGLNPERKQHLLFLPPADLKIQNYCAFTLNDVKGVTINGNALFNWPVCPKMLYGIYEGMNCSDNLITANNINWVVNDGVKSMGKNTLVANNLTIHEPNHMSSLDPKGKYQLFDVKTLDEIIEKLQ